MPDVQEVFRMSTQKVRQDPGALERQHTRQRRRSVGRKVGALVVATAIGLVAVALILGTRPGENATTPADESPTVTVHPDPKGVGLIGLPPKGAAPSTPKSGDLVLGFTFLYGQGDAGRLTGNLYADGRLIWWRLGPPENPDGLEQRGRLERRLTPEGVEILKAEVISTGLFDHDLHLLSAHGLYSGQIEIRDGDRSVLVTWGDCCDPRSEDVTEEMPTPEQAGALQRLDARLGDPASWLPADAWEDLEIKAYVASRYWVCYEAQSGIRISRLLASLPRPAEVLLRTWDRTHSEYGGGFDIWCSRVPIEEARTLAEILEDAGLWLLDFGDEPMYLVGSRDPIDAEVTVSFGPLLPHEA